MTKKLLLSFLMSMPLMASAASVSFTKVGDFYYEFNSYGKTASVTCSGFHLRLDADPDDYRTSDIQEIYSGGYSGSVEIPSEVEYKGVTYSVTRIKFYAFWGCHDLTSVTIPKSVTDIYFSAFEGCSSLTSIKLPDGVTYIGESAFKDCSSLTSITIPEGASVGDSAFDGTPWFDNLPDGVIYFGKTAYKYKGTMPENTTIQIKDGTLRIADYAFNNCCGLTSIGIPNSVTTIGTSAFFGCSNLTSVCITDLEAWCNIYFSGLNSNPLYSAHHLYLNGTEVKNMEIPNSITSIRNYVFNGCSGLTSITIPAGVTSIGTMAFDNCQGLTDVYCWADNAPSASTAFSNCNLENVTLHVPNSSYQKTQPWLSFGNIVSLPGCEFETVDNTIINFADSKVKTALVKICDIDKDGEISVWEAEQITNAQFNQVSFDKAIESFDEFDYFTGVTSIKEKAFYRYSNLTSIKIPNSVTSIGNQAFYYCTQLTSVVIPNSVTSIGNEAFMYCNQLATVVIPNSVTSIGNDAFGQCGYISLTTPVLSNFKAVFQGSSFSNIVFTVYSLSSFISNNFINSINQGQGSYPSIKLMDKDGNEITELVIPDGLTALGEGCFRNCKGLTSVTIPNTMESIGQYAFSGCSSLTSVTIPNCVNSIGYNAFNNCNSLTSVTIGVGVININMSAFNCPKLTDVYCLPETPPNAYEAFGNSNKGEHVDYSKNITLHVPESSFEAYSKETPWSNFKEIVPLTGEGQQIERCATPVITYENGEYLFSCATEGAELHYEISSVNQRTGVANKVVASPAFTLSVYATKKGLYNSETATATFTGIYGDVNNDGVVNVGDHVELSNIIMDQK